jgi:hypothetical protein
MIESRCLKVMPPRYKGNSYLRNVAVSLFALFFLLVANANAEPEYQLDVPTNFDLRDSQLNEPFLLSQVRRRPGGKTPKRRDRAENSSPNVPAATTVEQSRKNVLQYKKTERSVPPSSTEFLPIRNRWTMLYDGDWYDPYNQNIYKGDLRLWGTDEKPWFLELSAISDTLFESRRVPTPVSITSTRFPGRNDIFGDPDQYFFVQNLAFEMAIIRGNTTFKPQDFEFRITPVFNINYADVEENGVLRADPSRGSSRQDAHFSLLAAFVDYHLGDISPRYDFISTRVGVQPFNADFRGLVLNESQPGVRFFGNIDNNKYQWNLAWFHRLKLDANALLPTLFESRDENVFIANLYRQDLFALGHQVQFLTIYRDDQFGDSANNYDENGFITNPPSVGSERPKNVHNWYFGFNTDGHFGRLNLNTAFYYAFGSESNNPIADRNVDVRAWLAAAEASVDIDWLRPKVSFVWASGDKDPFDDKAEGFDAIFDNPNYLGGDNSYWVRQGIPLIGGGGVALTDRLSFLPDLRAGKAQGQSNFVNPGLVAFNVGLDVDVTPEAVWENNATYLRFDETGVLEALRADGTVDEEIGIDLSSAIIYRPLLTNNVQIKVGYSNLIPGEGFKGLYGKKSYYQLFANVILFY